MKKHIKGSSGFTIIEMIVVIAIIAILAAIILINVTGYINKSKDSAMKGNMHTFQTDVISNFAVGANYNGACDTFALNNKAWNAVKKNWAVGDTTNVICKEKTSAWCACSEELAATGTSYCVDSSGSVMEQAGKTCLVACTSGTPATPGVPEVIGTAQCE